MSGRGTVVLTGVGRRRSIGSGLALGLAEDGWDLVLNHWAPYDERLAYERGEHDTEDVAAECRPAGTPSETADLVRFLMSDAGGWINGQVLYSNGGFKTPS